MTRVVESAHKTYVRSISQSTASYKQRGHSRITLGTKSYMLQATPPAPSAMPYHTTRIFASSAKSRSTFTCCDTCIHTTIQQVENIRGNPSPSQGPPGSGPHQFVRHRAAFGVRVLSFVLQALPPPIRSTNSCGEHVGAPLGSLLREVAVVTILSSIHPPGECPHATLNRNKRTHEPLSINGVSRKLRGTPCGCFVE